MGGASRSASRAKKIKLFREDRRKDASIGGKAHVGPKQSRRQRPTCSHMSFSFFFAPVVQLDIEKLNKLAEQSKKTTNYNIIRLRGER